MSIFTEPMLSACIVLYHSGMHVLHAVQCFQESDIELELHVVDNSPGGTLGEHLQWQCPGVQYYPQRKDLGYAGGCNLVIPNLRSQYHLVCHPDVTFDPKLLTNMVNYMEHNKDCVILTPKVLNADGTEQFLPKRKFKDKKFAAGCSRDVIREGAERLGWELETLMEKTIAAMAATEADMLAELNELTNA